MTATAGVVTLVLAVFSIVSGSGWRITIIMAGATAWIAFRYGQERRSGGRSSGETA